MEDGAVVVNSTNAAESALGAVDDFESLIVRVNCVTTEYSVIEKVH